MANKKLLALDVGEKRIGVAMADTDVKIAVAYDTITVDGSELQKIAQLVVGNEITTIVVGYPRNQSGEPTAQTDYAVNFAGQLNDLDANVVFQDESLTSVKAEEILNRQRAPYKKGDVDALAASLILQDYLETH